MSLAEIASESQAMQREKTRPLISVVSPVYQSEALIDELVERLLATLQKLTDKFEIILIDDGSRDDGWNKIKNNCKKEQRIRGICLSRNFGQHFAITAGIDHAKGEWVVVMDCDLQDRPEEILGLYNAAIQRKVDLVLASRINRQDQFTKRLFSMMFYKILSFLSGSPYNHSVANFGIYNEKVIASVLQMKEKIRYFPAMVNWVGFKKATFEVQHSMRPRGNTSYNFRKQLKLAVDILLAYSDRPLRLIIGLGLSFSLLSFTFAITILYLYFSGRIGIVGYASIVTSVCFFSGVIISVLGVIGLYVGKIFDGIKNRPTYLVRDVINE